MIKRFEIWILALAVALILAPQPVAAANLSQGSMECDLVVEGKAFPHPSLVNAFIRGALPRDERLYLGVWHEVGHLQALPFVISFALGTQAV